MTCVVLRFVRGGSSGGGLSVRQFVACRDGTGDRGAGAPRGGKIPLKGPLLCLAGAALAWDRQHVLWEPPVLCQCRGAPRRAAREVGTSAGPRCGPGSAGDELCVPRAAVAKAGAVCAGCWKNPPR